MLIQTLVLLNHQGSYFAVSRVLPNMYNDESCQTYFCQTYTNSHITLQMGVSDIEYVNVYVLKETICGVERNLKKIAFYQMWIQAEAEVSGDTAAYVPVGQC